MKEAEKGKREEAGDDAVGGCHQVNVWIRSSIDESSVGSAKTA